MDTAHPDQHHSIDYIQARLRQLSERKRRLLASDPNRVCATNAQLRTIDFRIDKLLKKLYDLQQKANQA